MTFEWTSRDRRSDAQTNPGPQTAERHLGSSLPISHQPIKGFHVARGNSRDQLAFDLPYSCTQLHLTHQAPGSDYFSRGAHVRLRALSDGWTSSVILMSHTWMYEPLSFPHTSPAQTQRGWPLLRRQRRLIVSCWGMYRRPKEPRVQPFPVCQWLSCGTAGTEPSLKPPAGENKRQNNNKKKKKSKICSFLHTLQWGVSKHPYNSHASNYL